MPYADPKRYRDHQKEWREKNKDYLREQRKKWRRDNREYYNQRAAILHRISMRKWRRALAEILGKVCQKCGFDNEKALQFHHQNKDGHLHRRERHGWTVSYYKDLIKKSLENPGSIRLLCANCHAIEHWVEDTEHRPTVGKGTKRFTPEQIKTLRNRHKDGESISSLSKEFKTDWTSMRRILLRLSYKNVE